MSLPALPASLPDLSGQAAVVDALYRAVIGLDTNDAELFNSAFTDEAVAEVNGHALNGRDYINGGMFQRIGPLNTTHFITNVRVKVEEGGAKASLTASALAQHYRPGEGYQGEQNLLTGALYYLDLVKDSDGLWKSATFKMKTSWAQGDRSIAMGG